MPLFHKFYKHNWKTGFQANNAILDKVPYIPEVLFIGTFIPSAFPKHETDFFYGRNFFWTAMINMFKYGAIQHTNRRVQNKGSLPDILSPSLNEIFEICKIAKLSFADLIVSVFPKSSNIEIAGDESVIFDNIEYNLLLDNGKKQCGGLSEIDFIGQVEWNDKRICKYLIDNPQIKDIYITRLPKGVWQIHWDYLRNNPQLKDRRFCNIFSPSAIGLPGTPRVGKLIDHWLNNTNPSFGVFSSEWLNRSGLNSKKRIKLLRGVET